MKTYYWTADSFADEQDFYRFVGDYLAQNSAFGSNLDALYDVLTSVRDVTLILSQGWDQNLGSRAEIIHQVLLDAAEENPGLTILTQTIKEGKELL